MLALEPGHDKEIPDHRTLMNYDMVLISQNRFAKEYEPGAYSGKNAKGNSEHYHFGSTMSHSDAYSDPLTPICTHINP